MRILLILSSLLLTMSVHAATYSIGDNISNIELQDQFDNALQVDDATKLVLFSRDMKGGDIIKEALEVVVADSGALSSDKVYLADVSGMPSLIAKFIAIPKMKDLPFNIGLDKEGEQTAQLPSEKESATVIILENSVIVKVIQTQDADELVELLQG